VDILFLLRHFLFAIFLFFISAILTAALVRHLRVFDVPNERSSHTRSTPRGGGIAIVIAFLIGILAIHFIGDKSPIRSGYFLGFLAASFLVAAISLYDDIHACNFKIKLGAQFLAIGIAMLAGIVIDEASLPLIGVINWGWWAYPLTFLWIFGLTNAYNFIDGLDGLATSTAVIAALFLSYISFQQGSLFIYLAALTLGAASLGFLIYNFPIAKIFLGDVGSTFLGLVFAMMAIIAARYDHSHTSLFVVPLLLFHFIFDTTFTFFRRLVAGEHVFQAHRSHLYQLLHRLGYSHLKVTTIYSALAVIQGVAALFMIMIKGDARMLVFLPFFALYMTAAILILRSSKDKQLI
jgi:UDP-GlcNAc:undecaprenyl-phosphate GlcNAc-1-phosphate transferase